MKPSLLRVRVTFCLVVMMVLEPHYFVGNCRNNTNITISDKPKHHTGVCWKKLNFCH